MRDRFTDQARRVLDLARVEADGLGQRYLGPEHVVVGMLSDGTSAAARVLRAHGLELEGARAELGRLAERGVVAGPRPSDAELLGALGIDLGAVRHRTAEAFGRHAIQRATREATRARRRGIARVPRTPLEGPPLLISRTLQFAGERADVLGNGTVGRSCCCWGCWTTSPGRGPGACPTGGGGACWSTSACQPAIAAPPGRCWRPSG